MSRSALIAALGLLTLAGPRPARGQSVWWRAETLLTASATRPTFGADDSRALVPLLQYVSLGSADLGLAGLQVEVSGVLGGHLADAPLADPAAEGRRLQGDLIVGLARWTSAKGRVSLAAGRQYLYAGAGRAEHLDGLVVTLCMPLSTEVQIFGGRTEPWQVEGSGLSTDPSAMDEPWSFSNYAVGGRLRWRVLDRAVALVGLIHEGNGPDIVRQDLALDLGYWASRTLEGRAGALLALGEGLPQEVYLQLVSRPRPRLKLRADYSYQVPALLIPRTSIFSVFALDENHGVTAGAYYGLLPGLLTLGLSGGARLFPLPDADPRVGYAVTASARLALGPGTLRLAGLELELLEHEGERLLKTRLHALYRFELGLYATADLHLLYLSRDGADAEASVFSQKLTGSPLSLGGLGLLGYRFGGGLSVQAGGGIYTTPLQRHDLRLLAQLRYAGGLGGARP